MDVDLKLTNEITKQLKDDILYFGWIVQIADLQNPDRAASGNIHAVIECVTELHRQGRIVVGNAREANGLVLIDPWPEKGKDLRNRIASAIEEHGGHDRLFCFWIQLAKHFAR